MVLEIEQCANNDIEHWITGGVMGFLFMATEIRVKLPDLEARCVRQEADLSKTKAEITTLKRAADIFLEREMKLLSKSGDDDDHSNVMCGAATVDDIKGVRYQYRAIRRIAELNGGELNLAEAVDLVIAGMNPRGRRESILSTQRRRICNSGEWERVSRGVYRLREFDKPDDRGQSSRLISQAQDMETSGDAFGAKDAA